MLKPTLAVGHGGGMRFKVGSPEYQKILAWIRAGGPYGEDAKEGSLAYERIDVLPKETVLKVGDRQQLLVTATGPTGRRQDLTEDVLYVSNNPSVAEVSETGVIQAKKTGETAVLIRGLRGTR